MAYWGIAINRLLNPFNGEAAPNFVKAGQAAVEKAKAVGAKTQRERDYIEAVALLYTDVGTKRWPERAVAYEQAMAQVVAKYPADVEAKIFYALALNFAADLNDQTYAKPLKAAQLLELRRHEQDAEPVPREASDDPEQLGLRRDVDPAGRLVEQQHLALVHQPPGEHDLLLVAA